MKNMISASGIIVSIANEKIWRNFYEVGTEMVLTKTGRWYFIFLLYFFFSYFSIVTGNIMFRCLAHNLYIYMYKYAFIFIKFDLFCRNLFPKLQYKISGLEPERKYVVYLRFELVDNKKYVFRFHFCL